MNADYITHKCWCGTVEAKLTGTKIWNGYDRQIKYRLATCKSCGTLRTYECESIPVVNYDKSVIYEKIARRHLASMAIIKRFFPKDNILEIGSSSGSMIDGLRQNGFKIAGIDYNYNAVEIAQKRGLDVKCCDVSEVMGSFSGVFGLHVLEHVKNLDEFWSNITRLLLPGGQFYFAVPNYGSIYRIFKESEWGALNPTQHTWHFDTKTIVKMLKHYVPEAMVVQISTSLIWKPFPVLSEMANRLNYGDQINLVGCMPLKK